MYFAVIFICYKINFGYYVLSTHCIRVDSANYMLDESFCHFRGIGSILSILFLFLMENPLSSNVDLDQMPHYVVYDMSMHCLPMTFYRCPGKMV